MHPRLGNINNFLNISTLIFIFFFNPFLQSFVVKEVTNIAIRPSVISILAIIKLETPSAVAKDRDPCAFRTGS